MGETLETKICLVRHGCTDWNIENRVQGWRDIPLNNLGKKQVKGMISKIQHVQWDVIISSDLLRAKQTSDLIQSKLNIPILMSKLLRERNPGDLVGKTFEDVETEFSKTNINNSSNSETLYKFTKRIIKAMNEIAKLFEGHKIIIVTHGGFIKIFNSVQLKLHRDTYNNASFNFIKWKKGQWTQDIF